jgi:hypothetical protein
MLVKPVTSATLTGGRIRVSAPINFSAAEVAAYILRPDIVKTWLGRQSRMPMRLHSQAVLMQVGLSQVKHLATGEIVSLLWPARPGNTIPAGTYQITASMPREHGRSLVSIRISPRPSGGCRIRIQQEDIPRGSARSYALLWQGALNRVQELLFQAHDNYCRDRQAIILVHGIGEQRPGQMLREFMKNVFDKDAGEHYYIKPDYVSSLFEMRIATVPRGGSLRPTTDVYELYWAHTIRDTTLPQVYIWMLRLICSEWSKIPVALRGLVVFVRILLPVLAVTAFIVALSGIPAKVMVIGGGLFIILAALLPVALKAFGNRYIVNYAGDAARYLEPRAYNISRRQEIREAGVKLINDLHKKGRYSRMVVYGHSLGSVIAYDILSLAWARRSRLRKSTDHVSSRHMMALENYLNQVSSKRAVLDLNHAQNMQHKAWTEFGRNGFKWLITDFVTTGSPLAYAQWLLNADSRTGFDDLVRERTFPTCPPQPETPSRVSASMSSRQCFTFTHSFPDLRPDHKNQNRSVRIPHHGGLFAITRWTNLFFPWNGLCLYGDPVGGPLSINFGQWINDISLVQKTRTFAHLLYTNKSVEPSAVQELRQALRLDQSVAYYASVSIQDD